MLTAVLCTARKEPQFQWMTDSFVHALNFCNTPVELIVVDKLLWDGSTACQQCQQARARREELADAIRGRFSYRHVPPKPTAWQGPTRKTKRDFYALCNARNTGIALARGDQVVLFDDCSVLDELFLHWHAEGARRGVCVAGAFRSYTKATIEDGKILKGEFHPQGIDQRSEVMRLCSGSWMYGLNTSFPLEAALKINGYDEMYDGQGGSEDCDLGVRIEQAKYKTVFMPQCIIHQILETHEPVCDFAGWGVPQPRKQKERVLADGRAHFANEWLIQELLRKPRVEPLGNEFNLRELHKAALATGEFPVERAVEVDWRDNQPLRDME